MKRFFVIAFLIILTATVLITAYFNINPTFKKQDLNKTSGSLISHLKVEPELINREKNIPIILYHYVRDINPQPDHLGWNLSTPPSIFKEQMEYLVKENYTTITPFDLYNNLKYGKKLPQKPIILTFDDGYLDFFEEAFPILLEYRLKATMFVVTNFVGRENYLDWYHLRYMLSTGLLFIGGHTQSHIKLADLNTEQAKQEIYTNKTLLEESLDQQIEFFAYPYGSFNDETINILKKYNIKAAFTTDPGTLQKTSELLKLKRIKVGGGDTVQTFAEKINSP